MDTNAIITIDFTDQVIVKTLKETVAQNATDSELKNILSDN